MSGEGISESVCRIFRAFRSAGGFFVAGEWLSVEESRIGVAAVIVEDVSSSREVNEVLHRFGKLIVGRMGIPYRERGLSVISVILDGSSDEISALTGQLGKIPSVTVKAAMSKK